MFPRPPTLALFAVLFAFPLAAAAADDSSDPSSPIGEGPVVIAPLNLGVRPAEGLEGGLEPVWQEILRHFATFEPQPRSLHPASARALWSSAVGAGEGEEARDVYDAYRRFALRLAEEVDYDALVMPSLVPRVARIRGQEALWDGVYRTVELPFEVAAGTERVIADGLQVTRNGVRGEIEAASLHVVVLGSDGELRFEGVGGLTLLQAVVQGEKGKLLAEARPEPFADPGALREGIAVAFKRPLPASPAR